MLRRTVVFFAVGLMLSFASTAKADTLHGFCWGTTTCSDNGSNTPTSTNPPEFGFQGSGNGNTTGDLFLEILVPTDEDPLPSSVSFGIENGSTTTSATLVKSTAWSSGKLDSYLGISASPNNPIGAYAPDPDDSSAKAFYVYQDNLGTQSIGGTGGGTQLDLTLLAGLPEGSYILGFLDVDGKWSATANSGAILVDDPAPPASTPEPSSLMMLGTGIVGAAGMLRRRMAAARA